MAGPWWNEILRLRPELTVVADYVVCALVERVLRIVADCGLGEAGDRCVRVAVGSQVRADLRRAIRACCARSSRTRATERRLDLGVAQGGRKDDFDVLGGV